MLLRKLTFSHTWRKQKIDVKPNILAYLEEAESEDGMPNAVEEQTNAQRVLENPEVLEWLPSKESQLQS